MTSASPASTASTAGPRPGRFSRLAPPDTSSSSTMRSSVKPSRSQAWVMRSACSVGLANVSPSRPRVRETRTIPMALRTMARNYTGRQGTLYNSQHGGSTQRPRVVVSRNGASIRCAPRLRHSGLQADASQRPLRLLPGPISTRSLISRGRPHPRASAGWAEPLGQLHLGLWVLQRLQVRHAATRMADRTGRTRRRDRRDAGNQRNPLLPE